MRLVASSDDNKQYALDKKDYTVIFTLMDMGVYIGNRNREWWMEQPEIWKTMGIDIEASDPNKSIHSEFLVYDYGSMSRTIIKDCNGIKRVRIYHDDSPHNTKEEEEYIRGKGMVKVNGIWVQDWIVLPTNDPLGIGESYYYDEESGKFFNEDGLEAPQTIVSQFELPELLVSAGKQVADKFADLRKESENVPEEINIDDEISL